MIRSRLFAASLLAASALTAATPAYAQRIDRIVAFGDSYADDGNFFQLVGLIPPPAPYSTGRFSGATNYIDTLGQLLNAPIDDFAIGGALTDNTNTNGPPLGFVTEWNAFLAGGGGAFPTVSGTFGENDLLAVSIGGNDARFYQRNGGTVAGAPAAATASAAFATAGLNALVGAGAQNISFLAGNTAILPEVAGDPAAQAVRSAYSTTFNSAIQSTLAGYAADGVMVHYLDLSLVGQQITNNLAAYGLTGVACPTLPNTSCIADPSQKFLFYFDQLHLTSAGFAIVGQYVATQLEAPLVLQGASDMSLDVAHQFGRTLTSRMDTGSPRDGDMPEGLKLFVVGDGYSRHLNAGQRNDAYRSSGVGATAGVEYGFGSGVAGVAVNYTKPKINFGNDAAGNEGHSIQLGGYAGVGIAGGFVQGYAGYGWNKHDIERTGVVQDMEADPKGHHFIAGGKAGYLMPVGKVRAGPVIGLDYAKAKVDSYTESGDPALTLNVDSLTYQSLRGSLGLEVRGDFAGNGVQFRPFAAAAVEKDFTGDERTIRFAQTSAPTIVNSFALEDASKKAYGRFSGGFSAAIFSNVNLDVAGSATIGKDQGNETSANVGVRIGF
ncbi:autotransporter domain-containing protein [Sphingomonas sp. G124]|uniref:Autotransporter domain-containing protein n=1 Tax=Sphingomonas cremea TaxID=2904799 RepID=A0A9X1TZH7_9SPHN|nr:autotransporter domain-containing protein [Sphingomonas cremea]MCF2515842.1 autotransporter domain-containing protein [Sphingomonas cremea]